MITLPDRATLLDLSQDIPVAAAELPEAPLRMPVQDLFPANGVRVSMRDWLWPLWTART